MPTVSAARGFSPTDRSRSPRRVRKISSHTRITATSEPHTSRLSCWIACPMNPRCSVGRLMSGVAGSASGVPWSP